MPQPHYIAIEGPIGAGKTSLARRLAADLDGRLILEQPDENPFLPKFYANPERHALSTQLAFLLSRYQQQKKLQQKSDSGVTISDYSFAKDLVFAQLNLDEDELNLYRQIYGTLIAELPKPDLIIYLEADADRLKKHVKQRKIPYEKKIKLDYLEDVLEAYKSFFFDYNDGNLLVVNCTDIDFVNNDDHYKSLYAEITSEKRQPRHYVALGA